MSFLFNYDLDNLKLFKNIVFLFKYASSGLLAVLSIDAESHTLSLICLNNSWVYGSISSLNFSGSLLNSVTYSPLPNHCAPPVLDQYLVLRS